MGHSQSKNDQKMHRSPRHAKRSLQRSQSHTGLERLSNSRSKSSPRAIKRSNSFSKVSLLSKKVNGREVLQKASRNSPISSILINTVEVITPSESDIVRSSNTSPILSITGNCVHMKQFKVGSLVPLHYTESRSRENSDFYGDDFSRSWSRSASVSKLNSGFSDCHCVRCDGVATNSENDFWIHVGTGNIGVDFNSVPAGTKLKKFFTQPVLTQAYQQNKSFRSSPELETKTISTYSQGDILEFDNGSNSAIPVGAIYFTNGTGVFDKHNELKHDNIPVKKFRVVTISCPTNILQIKTPQQFEDFIDRYQKLEHVKDLSVNAANFIEQKLKQIPELEKKYNLKQLTDKFKLDSKAEDMFFDSYRKDAEVLEIDFNKVVNTLKSMITFEDSALTTQFRHHCDSFCEREEIHFDAVRHTIVSTIMRRCPKIEGKMIDLEEKTKQVSKSISEWDHGMLSSTLTDSKSIVHFMFAEIFEQVFALLKYRRLLEIEQIYKRGEAFIDWDGIVEDGFYGVAFCFRNLEMLFGGSKSNDKNEDGPNFKTDRYKWYGSFKTECLFIFDTRAFEDTVTVEKIKF